jgi:hypothetical protein
MIIATQIMCFWHVLIFFLFDVQIFTYFSIIYFILLTFLADRVTAFHFTDKQQINIRLKEISMRRYFVFFFQ